MCVNNTLCAANKIVPKQQQNTQKDNNKYKKSSNT